MCQPAEIKLKMAKEVEPRVSAVITKEATIITCYKALVQAQITAVIISMHIMYTTE